MLPIGLSGLTAYNGTYYSPAGAVLGTNTTVATLVSVIIPVMIVIGIILAMVVKKSKGVKN